MRTMRFLMIAVLAVVLVSCSSDSGKGKGGDGGKTDTAVADTSADGASDTGSTQDDAADGAGDTVEDDTGGTLDAADTSSDDGGTDASDTGADDTGTNDTGANDTSSADMGADASDAADVVMDTGDVSDSGDTTTADTVADTGGDTGPAKDTTDAGGGDTGGSSSWKNCSKPSECILGKNDCCGWCGNPKMTDLDAYNKSLAKQHRQDVCPKPGPCPACVGRPIPPGFKATCRLKTCEKVVLSTYNSCSTSADCVHVPLDCCLDCTTDTKKGALVAINKKHRQRVRADLCKAPHRSCKRCPYKPPTGITAVCQGGKCRLK